MFKFTIITVGKTKEKWLQEALFEYEKRLKPTAVFNWVLVKDEKTLIKTAQKAGRLILIDLKGKELTSPAFAKRLSLLLNQEKSRLNFVIGSDAGLPEKLRELSIFSLSLSKLTFTHQLCRLILLEQIYRCLEILKNSHYHK